jgi:hypothetical protein
MDAKALAKATEDRELERTYENIIIGGMFSIMLVVVLVQVMPRFTTSQVEVSTVGYPAVAGNAGLVWIQMTPAGQANQVRIISENSTGAFEEVLLGLTT